MQEQPHLTRRYQVRVLTILPLLFGIYFVTGCDKPATPVKVDDALDDEIYRAYARGEDRKEDNEVNFAHRLKDGNTSPVCSVPGGQGRHLACFHVSSQRRGDSLRRVQSA